MCALFSPACLIGKIKNKVPHRLHTFWLVLPITDLDAGGARNAAFASEIIRDIYPVHKGHVCWQCQASYQGRCDIAAQLHSNLLQMQGAGIRIWNTFSLKEIMEVSSTINLIWHVEIEKIPAPINDTTHMAWHCVVNVAVYRTIIYFPAFTDHIQSSSVVF